MTIQISGSASWKTWECRSASMTSQAASGEKILQNWSDKWTKSMNHQLINVLRNSKNKSINRWIVNLTLWRWWVLRWGQWQRVAWRRASPRGRRRGSYQALGPRVGLSSDQKCITVSIRSKTHPSPNNCNAIQCSSSSPFTRIKSTIKTQLNWINHYYHYV